MPIGKAFVKLRGRTLGCVRLNAGTPSMKKPAVRPLPEVQLMPGYLASASHFFMNAVLAAPARGLPLLLTALVSQPEAAGAAAAPPVV